MLVGDRLLDEYAFDALLHGVFLGPVQAVLLVVGQTRRNNLLVLLGARPGYDGSQLLTLWQHYDRRRRRWWHACNNVKTVNSVAP